jgi:hypothetical protein
MSGAEFVAVLGIAASAVQVVETCNRIIGRIREYHQEVVFYDLRIQLELFSKEIDHLQSQNHRQAIDSDIEASLDAALRECRSQLERLDQLIQSLIPSPSSSKMKGFFQGIRSAKKSKKIQDILRVLDIYRGVILFHLTRRTLQNTSSIPRLIATIEDKIRSDRSTSSPLPSGDSKGLSALEDKNTALIPPRRNQPKLNLRRSSNCARSMCKCSCHLSLLDPSETQTSTSFMPTIFCGCDSREYHWAMQLFRKTYFFRLSLHWQHEQLIVFSLNNYVTAAFTSPGFLILYKCEVGIMDLDQAQKELKSLRKKGEISFREVNPAGKGWIVARSPILKIYP